MFDPTVFDNLKVVLEGCVYDYDLEEKIAVTGRSDIVDLATLTRTFSVRFTRRHPDVSQVSATSPSLPWGYREDADPAFRNMLEHGAEAEIVLHAELRDLAGELLEGSRTHTAYGCRLWTVFRMVTAHDQLCGDIANLLTSLWGRTGARDADRVARLRSAFQVSPHVRIGLRAENRGNANRGFRPVDRPRVALARSHRRTAGVDSLKRHSLKRCFFRNGNGFVR
jgi:hypothetical protein